jgi:hypothetical protein
MKKYHKPIDKITVDKKLKLWCYELVTEDWQIVGNLISILEVCPFFVFVQH